MFEKRKVQNGAIKMDGLLYSAPELQWMHGKVVRVSQSTLYPHSVALFEREALQFICLAKNNRRQTHQKRVFRAIASEIGRERGQIPTCFESWVEKISRDLDDVLGHQANGKKLHAMNALLEMAAGCVQCIETEVHNEALAAGPSFEASLGDKKTADSADTETAA